MAETRTADGKRVVLVECPNCKHLSVADPLWETAKTLAIPCDQCDIGPEYKEHKVIVVDLIS